MLLDNFRRLLGSGMVSGSAVSLTTTNNLSESMSLVNVIGLSNNMRVLIGDDDSPVVSSQFALGNQITSGISQTNKSQFVETGATKLKTFYRFSSVITNTNDASITIKEIGLAHLTDNNRLILLIREVVEPYVLEPGESVQMLVTLE